MFSYNYIHKLLTVTSTVQLTWNGGRALMQLLHLSSIQAQQVLPEGTRNNTSYMHVQPCIMTWGFNSLENNPTLDKNKIIYNILLSQNIDKQIRHPPPHHIQYTLTVTLHLSLVQRRLRIVVVWPSPHCTLRQPRTPAWEPDVQICLYPRSWNRKVGM